MSAPSPSRNAVATVFVTNGAGMATWMSRMPDIRAELGLGPAALGLLLLCVSVGSFLGLPTAPALVVRLGPSRTVAFGVVVATLGLALVGIASGTLGVVWLTGLGFTMFGFGTGIWDVAMNVSANAVERALRRPIMSRFHAGFSLGTVGGAAVGVVATAAGLPLALHTCVVALLLLGVSLAMVGGLGAPTPREERTRGRSAWGEPRTLALGLLVLAFALTEGVANDWVAVAVVDGYDVARWQGTAAYALFVTAMTLGRLLGPVALARWGRVSVLRGTAVLSMVGVVAVVFAPHPAVLLPAVVLWGVGASLGFPVGMSAAGDDPARAAARVSVVATIGYLAFLGGPPIVGALGEHVGVLEALLVVLVVLVPAGVVASAAAPLPEHHPRPRVPSAR